MGLRFLGFLGFECRFLIWSFAVPVLVRMSELCASKVPMIVHSYLQQIARPGLRSNFECWLQLRRLLSCVYAHVVGVGVHILVCLYRSFPGAKRVPQAG